MGVQRAIKVHAFDVRDAHNLEVAHHCFGPFDRRSKYVDSQLFFGEGSDVRHFQHTLNNLRTMAMFFTYRLAPYVLPVPMNIIAIVPSEDTE